jgi:hypothetical protein
LSTTERLLKTEKKTIVLEALGDGKFSLSARGIDKPPPSWPIDGP